MDWIALKEAGMTWMKRYKYLVLLLILGISFMCLPAEKETPEALQTIEEPLKQDLQDSLSEILSNIYGAGKVKVLLTCALVSARSSLLTPVPVSLSPVRIWKLPAL